MAVHVAARIGGLAQGGEILASAETIAEAGDRATAAERTVPLKGATAPVAIAAVDWA